MLDHQGALVGQDDAKKKMMIGMFILAKLFVPRVFLKPESIGLDQIYAGKLNKVARL